MGIVEVTPSSSALCTGNVRPGVPSRSVAAGNTPMVPVAGSQGMLKEIFVEAHAPLILRALDPSSIASTDGPAQEIGRAHV